MMASDSTSARLQTPAGRRPSPPRARPGRQRSSRASRRRSPPPRRIGTAHRVRTAGDRRSEWRLGRRAARRGARRLRRDAKGDPDKAAAQDPRVAQAPPRLAVDAAAR